MTPIRLLLVLVLVTLAGCGTRTTSTYEVSRAEDRFSETVDGRTVSLANWELTVGDRRIPIVQVKSTIVVRRSGSHLAIDVNGQTVFEE